MDNITFPKVKLPLVGLISLFIFISLISFYATKVSYVVAVPIHNVSFDAQNVYFTGITHKNSFVIIQGKSYMYLKQMESNHIPIKYIKYSLLDSDSILITFENLDKQTIRPNLNGGVDSILITNNLFGYIVHNIVNKD